MLDSAQLATFKSAADDFGRAQQLAVECGHPIRPGVLELLKSASDRLGDCLKGLPQPYRAVRYNGATFLLIPKAEGFSLAVVPEAQVIEIPAPFINA